MIPALPPWPQSPPSPLGAVSSDLRCSTPLLQSTIPPPLLNEEHPPSAEPHADLWQDIEKDLEVSPLQDIPLPPPPSPPLAVVAAAANLLKEVHYDAPRSPQQTRDNATGQRVWLIFRNQALEAPCI